MATDALGAGEAAAGESSAGYGTPAAANAAARQTAGTSRKINPVTRDYELDANGALERMTAAQQLVYLALASVEEWPELITDDFEARIRTVVDAALGRLVSTRVIEVRSVDVKRARPFVRVRWVDTSTGQEFSSVA